MPPLPSLPNSNPIPSYQSSSPSVCIDLRVLVLVLLSDSSSGGGSLVEDDVSSLMSGSLRSGLPSPTSIQASQRTPVIVVKGTHTAPLSSLQPLTLFLYLSPPPTPHNSPPLPNPLLSLVSVLLGDEGKSEGSGSTSTTASLSTSPTGSSTPTYDDHTDLNSLASRYAATLTRTQRERRPGGRQRTNDTRTVLVTLASCLPLSSNAPPLVSVCV
jgi:hypothetical protein